MCKIPQPQKEGTIVCPSCHKLITIEPRCPLCGRKNPSLWGYIKHLRKLGPDFGFNLIVIWGCISLYAIALILNPQEITYNNDIINTLSPGKTSLFLLGSTGTLPIFTLGRWWTVFTSAWLHSSLLHIIFNLIWIIQLLPPVAQAYGVGRLIIIYTVSAIASALLTSTIGIYNNFLTDILHGATLAVGASGGIFGLLGALFLYGQKTDDFIIKKQYFIYAVVFFVIGLITPKVDNWGHLGGFLGGYLISSSSWLNPREKETHNHLLFGLLCLVMTIFSLMASIIHGLMILGFFPAVD
jgi:rhomboid protease GluP